MSGWGDESPLVAGVAKRLSKLGGKFKKGEEMKRTPLRKISKKKSREIKEEVEIRRQLWERCRGKCEECGGNGYPFGLHPHEKVFRSHGGRMSLSNSAMLCQKCHSGEHGIK